MPRRRCRPEGRVGIPVPNQLVRGMTNTATSAECVELFRGQFAANNFIHLLTIDART